MENYKAVIRSKEGGSTKSLLKKEWYLVLSTERGSKTLSIAFENKMLQ